MRDPPRRRRRRRRRRSGRFGSAGPARGAPCGAPRIAPHALPPLPTPNGDVQTPNASSWWEKRTETPPSWPRKPSREVSSRRRGGRQSALSLAHRAPPSPGMLPFALGTTLEHVEGLVLRRDVRDRPRECMPRRRAGAHNPFCP